MSEHEEHYAEVEITLEATLRLPAEPEVDYELSEYDWIAEAKEVCQEDVLFRYADREPTDVTVHDTWTE